MQNQILTVIFDMNRRLTAGFANELSYCAKIPVYLQNNIININVTWNRKSNISKIHECCNMQFVIFFLKTTYHTINDVF